MTEHKKDRNVDDLPCRPSILGAIDAVCKLFVSGGAAECLGRNGLPMGLLPLPITRGFKPLGYGGRGRRLQALLAVVQRSAWIGMTHLWVYSLGATAPADNPGLQAPGLWRTRTPSASFISGGAAECLDRNDSPMGLEPRGYCPCR